MINGVTIRNFKKFEHADFALSSPISLLVGQNNGGKTTAMQAITLWNFLIEQWRQKKGGGTAKQRFGAPVSRIEIFPTPVLDIADLWTDGSVRKKGKTSENIKIIISLRGIDDTDGKNWEYGIEATFSNRELLHCKPLDLDKPLPEEVGNVFQLPPLSGVRIEEPRADTGYQLRAVGEGRPGEILRNLLLELFESDSDGWVKLQEASREFFAVELLPIVYNPSVDPFILIHYRPLVLDGRRRKPLEISSAGSGYLQFLLISSFLFVHEGAVLLMDEPDSHLHVFLQRSIFEWLQKIALEKKSQIIISTHSEVLINSTDVGHIVTFFGKKPIQAKSQNKSVKGALSEVSPLAIIHAEWRQRIIYLEGDSDRRLLIAWADLLDHPVKRKLEEAFFHYLGTNDIGAAKKHFQALQSIISNSFKAYCLRDGATVRTGPDQCPEGLEVDYWQLSEIENYLIHPSVLIDFASTVGIGGLFGIEKTNKAKVFLNGCLAPDYFQRPHENTHLFKEKGSDFLERFFKHIDENISKRDYWQIAYKMKPDDVFPDVKTMLDKLNKFLGPSQDLPF